MTTINISLPQSMYEDTKKMLKTHRYASVSEVIRDALRKKLYEDQEITENGFTKGFEDEVLKAAEEPIEEGTLLETDEDFENYFKNLHKRVEKRRHDKS